MGLRFPTIEVRPGILGCLLVGLLACSPPGGPGAGAPEGTDPARVGISERLGDQAPLDTLFNDEEGRPIALKALVDKPTVLTLNYFACAGICTPLLHGVTEVLNTTARQPGRDFRVVTVSFDEKDTPSIAKMKRQNYLRELKRPFPPEAWRFLTGKGPSIRKLTDGVGFEFKASGKEFIHPGVLIVLSPQGVVTRYMYGINFLPADLDMAIDEAAKGVTRPSVVKALAFCYSLDPRGRKYVVKAASVVGTMTMLAALGFAAWLALGGRRTP